MAAQTPLQNRSRSPSGYLPSLDGWRALAVLGVMLLHDSWNRAGDFIPSRRIIGGEGVYVFFAISGFLITTRILEEERLVGRFHIGRFYVRRIFRIQPAALVYLAAVALVMLTGTIRDRWDFWWGGLFLFQNYQFHWPNGSALTGHFWTLSVEEHFYILLSLFLLVVRRQRILLMGFLAAASILLLKLSAFPPFGIDTGYTPHATQWQIHYLLFAAWLALLVQQQKVRAAVIRWLTPAVIFPVTIAALLGWNVALQIHAHAPVAPLRGLIFQRDFVSTWFVPLWILATVFHPHSWTTRLLETKPLRFLGRISYSLYLWHILFFFSGGPSRINAAWLRFAWERPERYVVTFAAALASYYLVEKPLIRLGHRLAPAATPGRKELADLPREEPDHATAPEIANPAV